MEEKDWMVEVVCGIPAALMLLVGIFAGGSIAWDIIDSTNPSSVFKSTFGVSASGGASDIRSSIYWFADTGSVYLQFRIGREEFEKLVPRDLVAKPVDDAKQLVPTESGSNPEWWGFRYSSDWLYFVRPQPTHEGPGKRGFSSESEYMAYDPSTGVAYYRFLGID